MRKLVILLIIVVIAYLFGGSWLAESYASGQETPPRCVMHSVVVLKGSTEKIGYVVAAKFSCRTPYRLSLVKRMSGLTYRDIEASDAPVKNRVIVYRVNEHEIDTTELTLAPVP